MSKRTKAITKPDRKKLFIRELEQPAQAGDVFPGLVTTLAIGEETAKGK